MTKIKRLSKQAEQNRNRVSYNRAWNKILVKEAIASSFKNYCANVPQSQTPSDVQFDKTSSSQEQLRRWSLKYNISKRAVTALLKILISFGWTWLPKDSRSLVSTPRNIEIDNLTNGKLWYNGITKNLEMIFANVKNNAISEFSLCFNLDGLPIFNSSKFEFWPILGKIFGEYLFI